MRHTKRLVLGLCLSLACIVLLCVVVFSVVGVAQTAQEGETRTVMKETDLGDGLKLREVDERDGANDKLLAHHGRITRDGETVLTFARVLSIPSVPKGVTRFYNHNGKPLMQEAEMDDGGTVLIFYDTSGKPVEVFEEEEGWNCSSGEQEAPFGVARVVSAGPRHF